MKNSLLNQSISVGVRMRPCEGKNAHEGNVVLQVVIGRKPDRIPLKIRWPLSKFDEKAGLLLPRHRSDQQCSDYNLMIGQAMSKANEICVDFRLSNKVISHKEFRNRFENIESHDLFAEYIIRKAEERYKAGLIKAPTKEVAITSANRWKRYAAKKKEEVSFATLSKALVLRFRNWLRDDELLEHNSIVTAIKVTKNYCRQAAKDNYRFDPEALEVTTTFRRGRKVGLNQDEVQVLKDKYTSGTCTEHEQECLKKFLFMIYTGLRISDANRVNSRHINNGELNILLYKTQDTGRKTIVTLPPFALDLIKGKKGMLFEPMFDQTFNRTMNDIGGKLGIKKSLSAHVARFTFARFLFSRSRNLKAVSELLGHASIRTTELYLQLDDEERGDCTKFLEEL